ncbi:alpha/beta hydrolase [Nocardia otitidiscaviarum]|uniref:alpha/beta fold hydrolase n=1 Tax=Nocardia otitidiscaviarum TaxID=1823 RepID=UPI0004A71152|nr:alpha/beta hydrolase [Nocardia otitidiscaviarum]MBF6136689.1 alpha/beta hydrolase [Nocardia otitidiscaviarum]MBF6484892.1 alpha/beta hydrolase [Nocardia otitidiscaviarum]
MIVLIGGLGDLPQQWAPLIRALGPESDIRHARRGDPAALAAEVAGVHRFVRRLGSERADLVAHSMGAFLAEAYARAHPEHVRHLVLLDPSVETHVRRDAKPFGGQMLRLTGRVVKTPMAAALAGRVQRRLDPALPRDYLSAVTGALRDPAFIDRCLAEWHTYPSWAADLLDLRRHTPPPTARTLIVTARRHRLSRWPRRHRTLADLLAARHHIVHPAGHLVMTTHPQRVAALIRGQLDASVR